MSFVGGVMLWLRGKPSIEDEAPVIVGLTPETSSDDSEENSETLDEYFSEETDLSLEPIFAGIKYIAANGATTQRRITFRRFSLSTDGHVSLIAHCHERNTVRSFRVDRIAYFFDQDGIVTEAAEFWRELGIELPPGMPRSSGASKRSSEKAEQKSERRPTLKTQLTVLAAMSRCDGTMRPEEIEQILQFALDQMESDGSFTPENQIDALRGRISRMRPTREAIDLAINKLFDGPYALNNAERAKLLRACHAVANADGHLAREEFDLLHELEGR